MNIRRIIREEIDDLDWVKDVEPRLPLKIGTCLTFKQYEEEEDWVEDEYGNMVDHGKMDWHIIGKFIDEYNDNKPTFKMVATDRMGEGREIWMEVEKVKELYDEGVYKPCKKQTYLKRIMREEIDDFDWVDSQSDRPLHNVTFKVKGYPETLYTIKDSGLRSSVKIVWRDGPFTGVYGVDGITKESTYMRDAVNKRFKQGVWIPTEGPITESSDLDWVRKDLKEEEDELEWIKDTSPNNIHISDLKKGMVVTLHHPGFSSLKNRKLTVDETWHDKEMGHCVHFKEMDKIQYPFGKDREPTIPGVYICEHLGVRFKLIDYPINESSDLAWIKDEPGIAVGFCYSYYVDEPLTIVRIRADRKISKFPFSEFADVESISELNPDEWEDTKVYSRNHKSGYIETIRLENLIQYLGQGTYHPC